MPIQYQDQAAEMNRLVASDFLRRRADAENTAQQYKLLGQQRQTPSASEQFEMNRQTQMDKNAEQDRNIKIHEGLTRSNGWKEVDKDGNDLPTTQQAPAQQSPAQKAVTPSSTTPTPASPFALLTGADSPAASSVGDGLSIPGQSGGGNGVLTPTSIAGGSPSGSAPAPSGGGPSAPSISSLLLPPSLAQGPLTGPPGGAPQGNAAATTVASRASSAQAGPLGQINQGSVTPSETAAGAQATSGPLPSASGSLAAQQGQIPPHKPDIATTDGHYYSRMSNDEINEETVRIARQNAAANRQLATENVEGVINDPQNAAFFKSNPSAAAEMRIFAQTGQKPPVSNLATMRSFLGSELDDALKNGDTNRVNQLQQTLRSLWPTAGQQSLGGVNNSGLSQAALDDLADKFNASGGDMPAMGMGNAAINVRTAIINRAAEKAAESGNPISLAANKATMAANTKSLGQLTTQHDALLSFENTGRANLELFENTARDLASKYGDTGIPWLNTPFREVEKQFAGNPDIPAYNAARQVAINEIAKVTANPGLTSVLSDSARKEVENFVPANATLAQTLRVSQVLKQDMENRRIFNEAQIGEITKRLGRGAASLSAESLGQESANKPKGNINVTSATPTPTQPRQWFDNHSVYSDDGGKTHYDYKTGKKLD